MEQEKHTLTNTVECMSTWLTLICATKLYCWQILGVVVEVAVSGATGGWGGGGGSMDLHACVQKNWKTIQAHRSQAKLDFVSNSMMDAYNNYA